MGNGTPQADRTHWQKFWIIYIILGTFALLMLFFFPSEEKAVSGSILAVARPTVGSSIVAVLKSNALHGSNNDDITFEATSDADTRIDDMIVCVEAPEFSMDPESGCIPLKVFSKKDAPSKPSPMTIHLKPKESSGTFKVLVTASWVRYVRRPQVAPSGSGNPKPITKSCNDDPASCYPIAEKVAMTLSPVNLGINMMSRFAGRLSRFLKDLTLPIILIVLAQWLTREASDRDRRRERNEKVLREQEDQKHEQEEVKRRDLEKEQEEEKQIARILLPKVMRLAGRYYLPLTLNSKNFVDVSASGRQNASELAFYLLSFFHVARTLKESEGGIFFKDLAAERMFIIVNNVIRALLVTTVGGEKLYMECLDNFETWLPATEKRWPRRAERPAIVPQAWNDVEDWLRNLDVSQFQAIRFLFNILAGTMRYESNAPYRYWYSNSRGENLFRLKEPMAPPPTDVFGAEYAADLEEFQKLLALYRQGKEK